MKIIPQRGFAFIPFLLTNWQLILLAGLALGVVAYWKHCEYVKDDYKSFIAKLEAQGKAQEEKVKAAIEQGRKDKEKADESHKRTVARLQHDIKRLRDNPPTSFLPPAAPGSPSPDRACVSRAEFDAAVRGYRAGILALIGEGDLAVSGLDAAKEWAK